MGGHDDLLIRMRRSKAGWREKDLHALYVGFGFEVTEGKKHRLYVHAKYSQLRATVTRARDLPAGYITYAVRLIEQLLDMEAGGAR